MIKNNNQKVISRMAGRSLNNNRRRSMIMIMAVALATFMLFSVFTVGITYFKMQKHRISVSMAENMMRFYMDLPKSRRRCVKRIRT